MTIENRNFGNFSRGFTYKQLTEPSSPSQGDSWFNTVTGEVRFYTGNNWKEIRQYEQWGTGSNYGYICGGIGGGNHYSDIERITFPFNSGAATIVGNLTQSKRDSSACNSSLHGFNCAGYVDTGSEVPISLIDRITFPFDSGTASNVGNLTSTRYELGANNSSIHGYIGGGDLSNNNEISTIDRITFPFDSGTASNVGNLTSQRRNSCGNNSSTYGYFCGGYDGSSGISYIDRFSFPFDSGTATNVGNLSALNNNSSACNSSTYSYICGGYDSSRTSRVERFAFPFDSGTATTIGSLANIRHDSSACNSSLHGYTFGGEDGTTPVSYVDRFTFPFDSGASTLIANISTSKDEPAATDGCDFVNHLTGPFQNKVTP